MAGSPDPFILPAGGEGGLTRAGAILGTPGYMAPEQARGEPLDARADVFALGATLAVILTGKPAFVGGSVAETIQKAAAADLSDVMTRLDSCGADTELIALAKRCLSADKEDRPADGRAVADEVAAYRAGVDARLRQAETDKAKAVVREGEQRKRRRVIAWASGIAIGLLLAGIVGTSVGAVEAWKQTGVAKTQEGIAKGETAEKEKARNQAEEDNAELWAGLDAMTAEIVGDSLGTQKAISDEQKVFLTTVLPLYRKLAARRGNRPETRTRVALAAFRVGMIEVRMGRKAEGMTAFQVARDTLEELAAEFPSVPEYPSGLAGSQTNIASVLWQLGKAEDAEREYRNALAHRERVELSHPFPNFRFGLASCHNNLGALLKSVGKLEEAEGHLRKGLAIHETLTDEFPALTDYRRGLAVTHTNLGRLFADLGKPVDAEGHYQKGLAIRRKLADESPTDPVSRYELSDSFSHLGSLMHSAGRRAEADKFYRKALAVDETLAAAYPSNPAYSHSLAITLYNIGKLLDDSGERAEADKRFRKALAIFELQATEFGDPDSRNLLATCHNALGILLHHSEMRAEAEKEYRKGLTIRETLANDFPAASAYRIDLGGSYCNLGHLTRDDNRPADSLPWFEKAIATLLPLHQSKPGFANATLFLRNSHVGLAEACDQLKKYPEAVREWDRSIELSPERDRPWYRVYRATSKLEDGQVTDAAIEVAELQSTVTGFPPAVDYSFARVYSAASAKVPDERENYTTKAMELLNKAVKGGFNDPAKLKAEKHLDPLRERDDFKKLLAELEAKYPPKEK